MNILKKLRRVETLSKLVLRGYHRIAILADDDKPYNKDDNPYYEEGEEDHSLKQ